MVIVAAANGGDDELREFGFSFMVSNASKEDESDACCCLGNPRMASSGVRFKYNICHAVIRYIAFALLLGSEEL